MATSVLKREKNNGRKRRGNEVESVFGDQKLNNRKRHYQLRGM
ncbi:MAG: hypothetical protein ABIJ34_06645 [archaeon]